MSNKNNRMLKLALVSAVSFMFAACGGRLPGKPSNPVTPISSTSPGASSNPSVLPSGNPSTDPKPPAGGPTDGPGELPNPPKPSATNPPPPDPEQPKTEPDFWNLMTRFGFTRTKDDMANDIKTQVTKKVIEWSPGTVKDKDKNASSHYQTAIKGKRFKNPPKDINEYVARSLTLAKRTDEGINYYLDISYGPKGGTINIQKVDAKTLEIVIINRSGLITNYTQTDGSLLRLAHFMLIPATVYSGKVSSSSVISDNKW